MASTVVNTAFLLRKMLDNLSQAFNSRTPALFLHGDGRDLSRSGSLTVLGLHLNTPNQSHSYIIHVHFLEDRAFSTLSTNGKYTLRAILENPAIPKCFFDVRMDADALYAQFDITLAGIIDIQLMELSSRAKRNGGSDGRLHSLESCFDSAHGLDTAEADRFSAIRTRGKTLWNPALGGNFDVFETRPLHRDILTYCQANVQAMPRLFEGFNSRLGGKMELTEKDDYYASRVLKASKDRVMMAKRPSHPKSSMGPWNDWNGGYWQM